MEGVLFSRSKPYVSAYLATDYVVRIDGKDVVIRPNERSSAVDKVLSRFKARSAAFITAFNPHSRLREVKRFISENARLETVRGRDYDGLEAALGEVARLPELGLERKKENDIWRSVAR